MNSSAIRIQNYKIRNRPYRPYRPGLIYACLLIAVRDIVTVTAAGYIRSVSYNKNDSAFGHTLSSVFLEEDRSDK